MLLNCILSFLGYNICFLNANCMFSRINEDKFILNYKKLLFSLFASILSLLLVFLNYNLARMFFSIFAIILLNYIFNNKSLQKTIFISMYLWLLGMLLDMLMAIVYSKIFPSDILNLSIVQFSASLILQLFQNLILLPKINVKIIKKLYHVYQLVGSYFLFIIFLVFIYFDVNIYIFSNSINGLKFLGIFLLIIIYAYYKIKTLYLNRFNKEFSSFLEKNNQYYINNLDKFRLFKHNMIHSLQGINSYVNEMGQGLINELINEIYDLQIIDKSLDNVPIGINGLIYQKISSFETFNCDFGVINALPYDVLDVVENNVYYEACKIIGVLVDNAIDAVMKMPEDNERKFYISFMDNSSYIDIQICNTFDGLVDIDKLGELCYSTKSLKRGFGLFYVINSKKIPVSFSVNNSLFVSNVRIFKKDDY